MTKVEQHIIEFAEKHPIFSPPLFKPWLSPV